jgi:hypothetical protein
VSATEQTTLTAQLQPTPQTKPVRVRVTDAATGRTPSEYTVTVKDDVFDGNIEVFVIPDIGVHPYRVTAPGYQDVTGTVEVSATEQTTLTAQLQPQRATAEAATHVPR